MILTLRNQGYVDSPKQRQNKIMTDYRTGDNMPKLGSLSGPFLSLPLHQKDLQEVRDECRQLEAFRNQLKNSKE
jgi:hypothetical protein